ncbi:MAG: M48 family metallopeptidase [Vicinamibacterales bacterium]|nr:M48 family metallopeptidase [Vicinamibacterales bacterium]
MNLYEQQALNRRRTVMVMVVFVGVLALLGLGFDIVYLGAGAPTIPFGTVAALGIGGGMAWHGYRYGDQSVIRSTRAVPIAAAIAAAPEADRLALRQFQNVLEEMSIASGLPMPAAYVVPDPDPNAFATGRDPEHASITVTEGLVRMLTREELQGVVAHEMAHIRNYDIRLMTIVAALVGAIALLADWSARGMRIGGRRGGRARGGKDGGLAAVLLIVVWIAAVLLAPLIARLLAMLVSRQREYLADATAAELTRNPLALAGALERIEAAAAPTAAIKRGSAHLCIADPLGRAINLREGFLADLFASHPPMPKRIAALKRMAYERAPQ